MEKCLHCETNLIHVLGRKQKSFCNTICRNMYFRKKNRDLAALGRKELQKAQPLSFITNNFVMVNEKKLSKPELSRFEIKLQIEKYKKELEIVPDIGFGKVRRKFLISVIKKLSS